MIDIVAVGNKYDDDDGDEQIWEILKGPHFE